MLDCVQNVLLQVDTTYFLKFQEDIPQTASKDGTVLINYLHLKFRLVNYLSISQPLKQESKVSAWCLSSIFVSKFFRILLSKYFLQSLLLLNFFFERHLILDIQTTKESFQKLSIETH